MDRIAPGEAPAGKASANDDSVNRAGRDVLALGIGMAAIIMFVGTGGNIMPQVVRSLAGVGLPPDRLLSNALILNIALIIFGLRRYRDLTDEVRERRRAEHKARELAETDPLTGLLNRRSIAPATDLLMKACSQSGEQVAFVMIDIDNFKLINDARGHSTGDAILQQCARRIEALLPDRALAARLGGDEFACVVPFHASRPERIDDLAGLITSEVARPVELDGLHVEVTVSVGIARSDATADPVYPVDAQQLLHMADVAMYQAKRGGKNRYFWFERPMEHELRFRSELEQAMRAGIPAGEFVPFYEQQIDLLTGRIVGFEMLARWQSPTFGLVGPEVFIPIAEEIGVIAELSERLIREALSDAREWNPEIRLAVNISPIQLRDPWFAQKLLKLLVEANFPPSRLEIEITESALHDNVGLVRTLITSLKNQGVSVSLDDFGSGYSSLAQLRSLPFDRLKIDRSFVTAMPDSRDSATIVQAISSLGEGLGLPITAEGVENAAVVAELQRLGQFNAQGYLYGRPEPADKTRERLAGLGMLNGTDAPTPDAEAGAEGPLSDVA
ncbi:putative bifunctional diguanylate cyclase/phosphodiesterase [Novosphingobium bradum]|uniref:Bifunctional diguanylate cyclase/phosphodiesterase n=1 Tax=Novosphingobium bradum TaxID=1737444 RepID=A0ABV7IQ52_9SPHN